MTGCARNSVSLYYNSSKHLSILRAKSILVHWPNLMAFQWHVDELDGQVAVKKRLLWLPSKIEQIHNLWSELKILTLIYLSRILTAPNYCLHILWDILCFTGTRLLRSTLISKGWEFHWEFQQYQEWCAVWLKLDLSTKLNMNKEELSHT